MLTCAASTRVTDTLVQKISVSSVLHWGVKAGLCLQESRKTEICDHVSIKLDGITSFQLSNIHVSLPSHTAHESYKRDKQLKLEYTKYLKMTVFIHEFMEVKDLCVVCVCLQMFFLRASNYITMVITQTKKKLKVAYKTPSNNAP